MIPEALLNWQTIGILLMGIGSAVILFVDFILIKRGEESEK